MPSKRWSIAPQAPIDLLRQYRDISPLMAQVLYNRGFTDPQAAFRFLYTREIPSSNPFAMKGMNQAVGRIRQAIKKQEPIVIYGDFDADGVTSTTLLVQVLRALKATVSPYIPHRVDEGYGLNSQALHQLAKDGTRLVITVDCGIRSVQEVEDGKAAGLDIIVTDHHSVGPEIPAALAVINPKQEDCPYPEEMLAGVGVAYKLAQALLLAHNQNGGRQAPLAADSLLDLVAIGTVADMMPLNHLENRVLVRCGLEELNRARRPGVAALMEVAGIERGAMTTTGIGFGLGPRINAAGRLDSAMVAYALLSAENDAEAERHARHLHELNTRRQELTRASQALIQQHLEEEDRLDAPLIIASDREFQSGIVGLVAGRLTEEFFRPAIVIEEGDDTSRGSCRSIPQFDITHALDQCADLLVRHGGHALAAGFTVANENLPTLKDRLMSMAQDVLEGQELVPVLEVDAKVDIHDLSEDLVSELQLLEPTGLGNRLPVLMTANNRVLEHRTVGKDNNHLKLKIARAGQPPLDAIGFGLGEWADNMPEVVDLAFYVEINEWNGRRNLQLNLQDIRPADSLA